MWLVTLLLLAQPANPWLDEARARADALDFAGAIERLSVARTVPGLSASQQQELLELLARCQVAEGLRADADNTWAELLKANPGYEPNAATTSPKIVESFEAVKKRLFPPSWVRLEEVEATVGRAAFRLVDPWHLVSSVQLSQRLDGGPWQTSTLSAQGVDYSFPVVVNAGSTLEWYLEALGRETVLARSADAQVPHVVSVPALVVAPVVIKSTVRPVLGWVLVGAAVVAAGVGTGLQVNGWSMRLAARDASQPPGDWADTAQAAEKTGRSQTTWATGLFIGAGVLGLAGTGVLAW